MTLKQFTPTLFLVAGMAALPLGAKTPEACTAGQPTAESYKWDFSREASQLLNGIQEDATHIRSQSDRLKELATDFVSWQTHATELASIKKEVNDMGRKLCRLEQIRSAVAPWQQKAIDRNAPLVRLMADNAQDAITFVRTNQGELWLPAYRLYTSNLYQESGQLSQSLKEFEQYAKAHRQELRLEETLGMNASGE